MWLLEINALQKLEAVYNSLVVPTDEQQKSFAALHDKRAPGESRLLTIAGDQAEIAIHGIMTQAPDMFAMFFGGGNVTYSEIITALAIADADQNVRAITLNIDSPGGEFDGLFDVLAAIQTTRKPVNTLGVSVVASGAYALAAQTDSINVKNISTRIGSIGVAVSIFVDDNVVNIASTNAPNKRPDVKTLAGQNIVRDELDAMHDIFADSIATGRGTTVENVNLNFGRGGTLLAQDALNSGMIDNILYLPATSSSKKPTNSASDSIDNLETKTMDLNTLKLQHPEIFAQVLKLGVDEERDRVTAHVTMGESYGDMKTACEAIKDGSGMTATIQAKYMTAGRNNKDINDREGDNESTQTTSDDIIDKDDSKVVTLVEKQLGIDSSANAA